MAEPDARFQHLRLRGPDGSRASITPHGAQVLSWQLAGEPDSRLYLSPQAQYRPDTAIRGGIPVLFPQFGLFGELPKHGLVRTRAWTPRAGPDPASLRLELEDDAASRATWPHRFRLALCVSLAARRLEVALEVENSGDTSFSFTVGLHSYLAVQDAAQLRLHGLTGLTYLDATRALQRVSDSAPALALAGEIDRVYLEAREALLLQESARALRIAQRGFDDVVVWNPGSQIRLPDMPAGDYLRMICVEAASIARPVQLAPGEHWRGAQSLTALAADDS